MYYDSTKIRKWCSSILKHYGVEEKDAIIIADVLVEADMRNIFSHGVAGGSGLDDIILKIINGGINLKYKLKYSNVQKYPSLVSIDADGAPGHSVSMYCVDLVKKLAREFGKASVYLHNSTHFGAAGIYSEKISQEKDLIGIVKCITPAWMCPFDSHGNALPIKMIGTNPIAWSTPYLDGIITIDMATTQCAASKALNAGKNNESNHEKFSIPNDYLIDKYGNEILVPNGIAEVKDGAILPLGGYNYGYKGYGLGLSIALEHIVGGCSGERIPTGSKSAEGRVGQVFEAVVVDSNYDKNYILNNISKIVEDLKQAGAAIPGEREHICRKKSQKYGIEYSQAQILRLKQIGKKANIEFI